MEIGESWASRGRGELPDGSPSVLWQRTVGQTSSGYHSGGWNAVLSQLQVYKVVAVQEKQTSWPMRPISPYKGKESKTGEGMDGDAGMGKQKFKEGKAHQREERWVDAVRLIGRLEFPRVLWPHLARPQGWDANGSLIDKLPVCVWGSTIHAPIHQTHKREIENRGEIEREPGSGAPTEGLLHKW